MRLSVRRNVVFGMHLLLKKKEVRARAGGGRLRVNCILLTQTMPCWLILAGAVLLSADQRLLALSPPRGHANGVTAKRRREVPSERKWWNAIDQLEARTVDAHVQKSLFSNLHLFLAKTARFETLNRINFSRRVFPVALTPRSEWPPVLGGCRNLTTRQGYKMAMRSLEPLAHAQVGNIPALQRVIIQNALWDVFDEVYYQGADPWRSVGDFHRRRWKPLLLWLAHDMSRIAVPQKVLMGFRKLGIVRRLVLGKKLWRRATELYSLQQLTIHSTALGFRRVVRIYVYDPKEDWATLPRSQFLQFCRGKKWLPAGSVAIEVEDAVAVLPGSARLFPTRIPIIARSYRVVYSGKGDPILAFSIYRFPQYATELQAKGLRRLPGSFSTWALLNLPTIPNGSIGYLAKFSVVCAQCHFPGPLQSFATGLARPMARYFRLTRSGTGFVQNQTISRKIQSLAYTALTFYCNQPLPTSRRARHHKSPQGPVKGGTEK
jgi:hypothetical protein